MMMRAMLPVLFLAACQPVYADDQDNSSVDENAAYFYEPSSENELSNDVMVDDPEVVRSPMWGVESEEDRRRAERETDRQAGARWWIIAISADHLHLAEGPPRRRSDTTQELWISALPLRADISTRRTMQLSRFDCSRAFYRELHRATFDSRGSPIESSAINAGERRIVPGTAARSAFEFACGRTNSLIWPIPLARDDLEAASIAGRLERAGEDVDTAVMLASLDPELDRHQIGYIIENTVSPRNRALARTLLRP